ncbi:MAG: alkaline phosphatase family protein [Planctomycetes bacterium]|nr:alkaline phosphatase family protein [Planctomycetota bacterium]
MRRSKASNAAAWKRKVILLGFDSCDPDLLEDLIRQGKLPHFARMRREGASGILESIQPVLSPVVWTTIATGMPPERHGILDFVTETSGGLVPVSSKMRAADTVWDVLSRHGETVGVVGWLVTYPAEPLNGFMVTDRMGLLAFDYGREIDTEAPLRTWPDDLAKEIETSRVTVDDLTLASVRPFADVSQSEFAAAYSTRFHPLNRLGNLRLTLATAETFRGAGQRLLAERRPRFFAAYFEAMDALSHLFMRYAPPKLPEVDEQEYLRYRTAIEANYVWHDRVLGEYMDLADADTTIFLVSDHGFKSGAFRRGDPSDFHAKTGAMWHRQYGVFHAWGNGVARGVRVDGASVFDIAPTVLAAMGYPTPADMQGRVLEQAFEGGLAHESVPTYFGESRRDRLVAEGLAAKSKAADLSPEQQAELERMASLGYISGDRKDPANTQMNLGHRFIVTGRFEDAREQFTAALKRQRTPGTLCSLAESLLLLGRPDEAATLVAEAVGIDPSDVMARLLSARIHMAKGESAQAELLARAVVADKPDLPMTHGTLAWILEARGSEAKRDGDAKRSAELRAESLGLHEAAIRLEPNQIPSLLAAANLILENAADIASIPIALDHLDRIVQLRPDHVVAWNARAVALLRLGMDAQRQGRSEEGGKRLTDALESATRAVDTWRTRSGKEYAKGWANSAYALWRLDRMDDALAAALKARGAEPTYAFAVPFVTALATSGRTLPAPPPSTPPRDPAPPK